MAVAQSAYRSSINISNISKSVFSLGKGIKQAKSSALKTNTILLKSTRFKRESIARDNVLFQRRREAVRRKEQEDIIESSGVRGAFKRQKEVIANSTKGFLGRIMDFVGTLMVGWLLNNLPLIIKLGEQLIRKIRGIVGALGGFVSGITQILSGFGSLLNNVFSDIIQFKFSNIGNDISSSMNQMSRGFESIERSFDAALDILREPLDFTKPKIPQGGVLPREGEIPPNQTNPPSPQPSQRPSGGGGGGGGGKWKPVLDLISKAESSGGSYDSRFGGIYPGYSKLTIAEADKVQRENYKKWGSGASGRYQFMDIMGQAAYAGLKPTDLFSPANQDKMAIALIEKKKEITIDMVKNNPKEAQLRLAQEWAGIPTPSGKSFYPPPNYATVKNSDVQEAFNQIGSPNAPATTKPAPTPPKPAPPKPAPAVTTSVQDQFKGRPGGAAGQITGSFGEARGGHRHAGIDIAPAGPGYYVAFKQSGKIDYIGFDPGGYGNFVDIKSGNTIYRFAHLAKVFVKNGQSYNGQTIGEIGSTGGSTGIHLHFEVRPNGKAIDPRPYIGMLSIGKTLTGVAGQPTTITTPAKITAPPTGSTQQMQAMTPERSGPTVVVAQPQAPQMPVPMGGEGGGGQSMPNVSSSEIELNRLMTHRLLLELAYT